MKLLNLLFILLALTTLASCGLSSRDSESVGQIKKVAHITPLVCPDRYDVDVSLGVMRNGVGSVSHEDMWLTAAPGLVDKLKQLAENGTPVKIVYDVRRFTWCEEERAMTSVEAMQ